MKTYPAIGFFLLFVISYGSSENSSTPRGCGLDLLPQYVYLCDLDAIWGIVVEAVAGAGVLTTLLLMLILLVRLPFIKDKEKKSPLGMHFLFLLGTLGLFGLAFAFIIQEDETVCSTRRFLWGVIFALCFSCLLAQAWRLRRLVRHGKSPSGWHLAGVAICLMLVQVIIATEWLILTIVRDNKLACSYEPMDFAMALIYVMFLMVFTMGFSLFTLCGKFKKWKKNGVCLIITLFFSILIWVAWMTMYLFGNAELKRRDQWSDPTLAIALVSSGWVFLIFHAIPEVHCTILPSQQETTPNYFDTSQPRMRETAFEEDIQLPRSYMENKAFSMDEHNAGKNLLHRTMFSCNSQENNLREACSRCSKQGLLPTPHSAPYALFPFAVTINVMPGVGRGKCTTEKMCLGKMILMHFGFSLKKINNFKC